MRKWYGIIVDDNQQAIDYLLSMMADILYIEIVATFTNEEDAKKYLLVNAVDFLILDVELRSTNAFRFLTTLSNPKIPTILYTGFEKYEDRGYDMMFVDVLLKPVSKSRLLGALRRLHRELEQLLPPPAQDSLDGLYDYFQIKGPVKHGRQIVWFKNIVYIDKANGKLQIHLVGGRTLESNDSFRSVQARLPAKWFKQCYQSVLFNINFYQGHGDSNIILTELRKKKGRAGDKADVFEHIVLPVGGKEAYVDFVKFLDSNLL